MDEAATLTYPTTVAANLPEPTETSALCGEVQPTPSATLLYGALTINGQAAPVGSRIELVTPRGEVAGCVETVADGFYGAVFAYGADETAATRIPGFVEGEAIGIRINGMPAQTETPLQWSDDKTPHSLDLSLNSAWNLYLPSVVQER